MKTDFKYLDKRRLSAMERGLLWGMVVTVVAGAGVLWLLVELIG